MSNTVCFSHIAKYCCSGHVGPLNYNFALQVLVQWAGVGLLRVPKTNYNVSMSTQIYQNMKLTILNNRFRKCWKELKLSSPKYLELKLHIGWAFNSCSSGTPHTSNQVPLPPQNPVWCKFPILLVLTSPTLWSTEGVTKQVGSWEPLPELLQLPVLTIVL